MRVIVRRVVFWFALVVAILSWATIRLPVPLSPYVTTRGDLSAEWLTLGICDAAFGVLLLWSAAYLRTEALLARIALIVTGAPFVIRALAAIWSSIHSAPTDVPVDSAP